MSPVVKRTALILCAAFVVLVPSALAAAAPAYMTPKAMAAKLTGGVPQLETGNAHVPTVISGSICTGLGAAHQGKFNTFRCKASYLSGQKTVVVWARARPGGQFCASVTGLNACPAAAPTVGDPRVCTTTEGPTADPNACSVGAAIRVLIRAGAVQFENPGFTVMNLTCSGQNLTYACVFSTSASYTVYHTSITFAQSPQGAWTATLVFPTGTCTAQPGAASGGSRWTAGPAPNCPSHGAG